MQNRRLLRYGHGRRDLGMNNDDILREIVSSIKESADEIRGKTNRSELDYGMLLAYAEALSIIRDICGEENLHNSGLDFDIDARYLL